MKKSNLKWAVRTFVLSICLSILFSMISQSLFPTLSSFLSVFIIVFFIVLSVIFDMIAVAVTSADISQLEKYQKSRGYKTAVKLCQNTEKVSSFCGDVVGDICGILSGAGGVSLVVNLHIEDANICFLVTCFISSLIAGITIFGKAIMKNYAVEKCDVVVISTGKFFETSPLTYFKKIFKRRVKTDIKEDSSEKQVQKSEKKSKSENNEN